MQVLGLFPAANPVFLENGFPTVCGPRSKIEGTRLKAMRAIHLTWGAAVSKAARLTAFAVLVGAVGSVPAVQAATPTYRIVPLGLADPSDPASIILPIAINDLGVVVSFAYRTNELPEALR
jgi:hypothetical protein